MGMEVKKDKGIHLPSCGLWLDPGRKRELAAVTHAHSDHAGWHIETLATPATCALMRARMRKSRGIVHELPFDQPFRFAAGQMTLLPAGHVLGSAQVFVETDAESLLYTGDFKLRNSLTSEPARAVKADTLILETTFGRPRYHFPPVEGVVNDIIQFCRKAIEENHLPVLLAYSLGKAQELIARLAEAGLPIALHAAVWNMTRIYQDFGVKFPPFELHLPMDTSLKVLIYPPNTRSQLAHLPNTRTAIISGWALDSGAIYRFGCDAAFPLSDHADYDELLQYVEMVQPKRVFTVHGFVEDFARDLRRKGMEAWALGGVNQLELLLAA